MGIETKSQISDLSKKVGHDLKSPLRKLRQFSELMRLEYSDILDGDGEIYLTGIGDSAEEVSELVDNLLVYIRCLTDVPNLTQVDLNDVMEIISPPISTKFGPSVDIEYGQLPTVHASKSLSVILFTHLLENACRFNGPDQAPMISIKSKRTDNRNVIQIEDNGIGITGEGAEKVFDPLMRLHPKSDYKGSGLGLAICKVICDVHGWEIGFTNNPHGGTIFKLTLPASQSPS